jgi:predicted metal-dependent phosphoesterase TrpH
VEISTAFAGRELHLLGYFVRPDHDELNAALATVCESRRERFWHFVALLRERVLTLPDDRAKLVEDASASLGRRHVAELLVACGQARTRTEAFHRFVNPLVGKVRPKSLVPLEEAVRLVHAAGGVTSLAHPPADFTDAAFACLSDTGLDAIEVVYPWGRNSPAMRLREVAARFGFAISGGSDCHGADPADRRIGSHAITSDEFAALRERAACAVG